MFSKEFLDLLVQLIKSWQVIAVSIVLVIYLYIVSYTARSYHRPRAAKKITLKKTKKAKPEPSQGPEETESGHNTNDELGLEEA